MANGHGGYRRPSNPAAVSGPGALSARTDGGAGQPVRDLPDAAYGENKQFREAQQGSPLARVARSQPSPVDLSGVTPLGAPSASPDPVTTGADAGPGPGLSSLGLPGSDPVALAKADGRALAPYLTALVAASQSSTATPSFRRFVRKVLASQ